ncbi:hypothetical protein [Pectobacterium atrosepticum]|uniref:hypothetical protein n=1 Tax=Pectobacterium atrosepticum TaxID=29471 RepID=UPI000A99BC93|nr:hypothetical protein [Pectobacterium atrosepticum]
MKTRKGILCAVVWMCILTGCDAAKNELEALAVNNETTIVIPKGFQIEVAGRSVPIQGFDRCPEHQGIMSKLFGSASDERESSCIVLHKDRASVPVLLLLPSGAVREDWGVIRAEGVTRGWHSSITSLQRPDGSPVVPSEKKSFF